MSAAPAPSGTRTGLRALGLALAASTLAELCLLSETDLSSTFAILTRLFVLGATASLLAGHDEAERQGVAVRPLFIGVVLTLVATFTHTLGDALMTILWSEAPLPLVLLSSILGALLPLLALTLTVFALTPLDGRGIATLALSTMLAFAGAGAVFASLGGSQIPWLLPTLRAASTALTLITLLSRFSIFKTSTDRATSRTDGRSAMALAPELLWRDALLGARLLRAAELTRLLVMMLVFLLGFALLPLGPAWLVPLLIGQDLALVFIALTTLLGLIRLSRVPTASGARGAAIAGLVLSTVTLIQVVGAAAVDVALVLGRPQLGLSVSLDTSARFSTLGTLVAVCLVIVAIARGAHQPALRQRALGSAVFYFAATLSLTGADQLGQSDSLAAVLLKLAALLLFTTGFLRLVRALTEVGPLIEDERRRALGHEFA